MDTILEFSFNLRKLRVFLVAINISDGADTIKEVAEEEMQVALASDRYSSRRYYALPKFL